MNLDNLINELREMEMKDRMCVEKIRVMKKQITEGDNEYHCRYSCNGLDIGCAKYYPRNKHFEEYNLKGGKK